MILSYHPIFVGDKNIICAGREPDDDDLAALKSADAVILPQGCTRALYDLSRNTCRHVFPNFDAKFKYPGKIGQILLFREKQVPHPRTEICYTLDGMESSIKDCLKHPPFSFPFVFKFDWGGEGESVFLIPSEKEYLKILERARAFERSGWRGFLLQEFIPSQNRSLRVVVIGQSFHSYWRVQEDTNEFRSNIATGAKIDADTDPGLQHVAVAAAKQLCVQTGINLAGFDFLFSSKTDQKTPLFLEINYYFGRKALGGSEKYYHLLVAEIQSWINHLNLKERTAL